VTESELLCATATRLFAALERRDAAAALALWHDDGTVAAAFNPNGDTAPEAIRSAPHAVHLAVFLKNYDVIAFRDVVSSVAGDGVTVWVETRGEMRVAATQTPYQNRYVFKFTIEQGRIRHLLEYANTVTQSLHGAGAAIARSIAE
jgi:ketosteroid isomerase-like protein